MVGFSRYSYDATIKSEPTFDADGNPIAGSDITLKCDYQPTAGLSINVNGSFLDIKYKLYIPHGDFVFKRGSSITCNGVKGVIVESFKTYFNTELWVQ